METSIKDLIERQSSSIGFKFSGYRLLFFTIKWNELGERDGIMSNGEDSDEFPLMLVISKEKIYLLFCKETGYFKRIDGDVKEIQYDKNGDIIKVIGTSQDTGPIYDTDFHVEFNKQPLTERCNSKSFATITVLGKFDDPDFTEQWVLNNCEYIGKTEMSSLQISGSTESVSEMLLKLLKGNL